MSKILQRKITYGGVPLFDTESGWLSDNEYALNEHGNAFYLIREGRPSVAPFYLYEISLDRVRDLVGKTRRNLIGLQYIHVFDLGDGKMLTERITKEEHDAHLQKNAPIPTRELTDEEYEFFTKDGVNERELK